MDKLTILTFYYGAFISYYLYNSVHLAVLWQKNREASSKFYFGLSFLTLIQLTSVFIAVSPVGTDIGDFGIQAAAISGYSAIYFYFACIDHFFQHKLKVLSLVRKITGACAITITFFVIIQNLFEIPLYSGPSLSIQTQPMLRLMNVTREPTIPNQIVGIIAILAMLFGFGAILHYLKKNKMKEPLLVAGLFISVIAIANDASIEKGLTQSFLPLYALGFVLEIYRFIDLSTSTYHKNRNEILLKEKELSTEIEKARFSQIILRVLSHDISNGIQNIELARQSLETRLDSKEFKAPLQSIRRGSKTITEIGEFARNLIIEEGLTTESFEYFPLQASLRESQEFFRPKLAKKGQTLTIDCPSELQGFGHEVAFRNQIIGNLLSNAIKFSPFDREIKISASKVESKILIEISNGGEKLDQEKIDLLLKEQRSKSGTGGEKGHGLGLNIVSRFVKKMNGEITFSPLMGGGLKATIELPNKKPS